MAANANGKSASTRTGHKKRMLDKLDEVQEHDSQHEGSLRFIHGPEVRPLNSQRLTTTGQPKTLRQQIIEESKEAARKKPRRPQSKWFKAPKFAGTAAFDLNDGLTQLPYSKTEPPAYPLFPETAEKTPASENLSDCLSWEMDDYHSAVMRDLADMSRASSASPIGSGTETSSIVDPEQFREQFVPLPETLEGFAPLPRYPPPSRSYEPITESQLMAEVKDIYAGLIMTESSWNEPSTAQGRPDTGLGPEAWDYLLALHKTLLDQHHDFFLASQHPTASNALKQLAVKYAMPARMWKRSVHDFMGNLRRDLPASQDALNAYFEIVHSTMDDLQRDVPQMAGEWDLIKYNLREYFAALQADGVDIPMSLFDDWERQYSPETRTLKKLIPPIGGFFFGDEDLPQWALPQLSHDDDTGPSVARDTTGFFTSDTMLSQVANYMMSGWLRYGRRIATSFHSFTQSFVFLGLVGTATWATGLEY